MQEVPERAKPEDVQQAGSAAGVRVERAYDAPAKMIREAWMERFGLKRANPIRDFPVRLLFQLSFCKSDEARRLILDISS